MPYRDPLPLDVNAFPVVALRASHEWVRFHLDALGAVAELPDLREPRAWAVAGRAHHYIRRELPIHVADEDDCIAPHLRRALPRSGALLDDLARAHADVDACLWTLLTLLRPLMDGHVVPHAAFRASVWLARQRVLPGLQREEEELFPLCEALTLEDRVAIARDLQSRRRGAA